MVHQVFGAGGQGDVVVVAVVEEERIQVGNCLAWVAGVAGARRQMDFVEETSLVAGASSYPLFETGDRVVLDESQDQVEPRHVET